jgi:hypothetical protein
MRERDRHNLKIGRKRCRDQRKTATIGKSRRGATLIDVVRRIQPSKLLAWLNWKGRTAPTEMGEIRMEWEI